MFAAVPPTLVLAALLVLLGTQVAYVVAPRAPHYLLRLGLSAVAVLVGELIGAVGIGQRFALGDLHPATDIAMLVVVQWLGGRVRGREQIV